MLSSVLDATFAAVSSDGVRTSTGSSADCAGRNTVPATVVSATSAYTTGAGPSDGDRPGRGEHERAAREVARHHHGDAREAIDERRRERRRDRRGDEPDQPDEADGRAPPWSYA